MDNMDNPKLVIMGGPTGSGKTRFTEELKKKLNLDDERGFYINCIDDMVESDDIYKKKVKDYLNEICIDAIVFVNDRINKLKLKKTDAILDNNEDLEQELQENIDNLNEQFYKWTKSSHECRNLDENVFSDLLLDKMYNSNLFDDFKTLYASARFDKREEWENKNMDGINDIEFEEAIKSRKNIIFETVGKNESSWLWNSFGNLSEILLAEYDIVYAFVLADFCTLIQRNIDRGIKSAYEFMMEEDGNVNAPRFQNVKFGDELEDEFNNHNNYRPMINLIKKTINKIIKDCIEGDGCGFPKDRINILIYNNNNNRLEKPILMFDYNNNKIKFIDNILHLYRDNITNRESCFENELNPPPFIPDEDDEYIENELLESLNNKDYVFSDTDKVFISKRSRKKLNKCRKDDKNPCIVGIDSNLKCSSSIKKQDQKVWRWGQNSKHLLDPRTRHSMCKKFQEKGWCTLGKNKCETVEDFDYDTWEQR